MKKTTKQVAAIRAFLIASTILHFTFLTLHSYAATINQVIVRQQWPWSTAVKVEYRLSGVTAPVDIDIAAEIDGMPVAAASRDAAVSGARHGLSSGGA